MIEKIYVKDDKHPESKITQTREISRVLLYNEKGEFLMHHVLGDDIFGHRDYLETPGGGIENGETPREAAIREVKEETGYDVTDLQEVIIVEHEYFLLSRYCINHFFVGKASKQKSDLHLVSKGDSYIASSDFYSLDYLLEIFFKDVSTKIGQMVYKINALVFHSLINQVKEKMINLSIDENIISSILNK